MSSYHICDQSNLRRWPNQQPVAYAAQAATYTLQSLHPKPANVKQVVLGQVVFQWINLQPLTALMPVASLWPVASFQPVAASELVAAKVPGAFRVSVAVLVLATSGVP